MTTPQLWCGTCLARKDPTPAVTVIDGQALCLRHVADGMEGDNEERLRELQGALSKAMTPDPGRFVSY
jgi:hypothetical protein